MPDQRTQSRASADSEETFRKVVRRIVEEPLSLVRNEVADTVHLEVSEVRTDQRRLRQSLDELRQGRGEHAYTLPELVKTLTAMQGSIVTMGNDAQGAANTAAAERQSATADLIAALDAQASRQQAESAGLSKTMETSSEMIAVLAASLTSEAERLRHGIAVNRRLLLVAVALLVLIAALAVAILSR